jgi:hypothetical protein
MKARSAAPARTPHGRDPEAAQDEEVVDAEEAAPDEADVVRHDGEVDTPRSLSGGGR